MGPGFVFVQEWLTRIYKRKVTLEGPRMDGMSVDQLTATYRSNFRDRVLKVMASRVANMMRSAGQGSICLRKNRCTMNS